MRKERSSFAVTWRISGSHGYIQNTHKEGESPPNQVKLVSSWDLGKRWEFDATLRYVDDLESWNLPHYITMDCRLAWMPNKRLAFAVIGRNLLQDHHAEFGASTKVPYYITEVSRSVFGKVTWRY